MTRSFFLGLALCASVVMAAEPDSAAIAKAKIGVMENTKISMRTKLPVPAHEYKSDGDPGTLEIVYLEKKEDGPSRVSDDGEVVFLYKASDRQEQALTDEAFEIRARKALMDKPRS